MAVDIEGVLTDIGVQLVRSSGDELFALCPMHEVRTGKPDAHPSWSINTKTFVHHCFSCGYSGSLTGLYIDLMGEVPEGLEWEIAKSSVATTLNKALAKEEEKPLDQGPAISEWNLANLYRPVPERIMDRRHLSVEAAERFEIKWDKQTKCLVIPIRSPDGDLLGYQFKQKGVFINYPPDMEKSGTLFGLHLHTAERRITVVESPLDAVRLSGLNIPTVATYGASVSDEQVRLLAMHYSTVVLAMDNDDPGRRSNDYLAWALGRRGVVTPRFSYRGLDAKDPGDVKFDKDLTDAWYRSITFGLLPSGTHRGD